MTGFKQVWQLNSVASPPFASRMIINMVKIVLPYRTVCRRAERVLLTLRDIEEVPPSTLKYINRLSDAFFVWSRFVCQLAGIDEVLWQPNAGKM
jgi:hypothetical protein